MHYPLALEKVLGSFLSLLLGTDGCTAARHLVNGGADYLLLQSAIHHDNMRVIFTTVFFVDLSFSAPTVVHPSRTDEKYRQLAYRPKDVWGTLITALQQQQTGLCVPDTANFYGPILSTSSSLQYDSASAARQGMRRIYAPASSRRGSHARSRVQRQGRSPTHQGVTRVLRAPVLLL
ncbi:hypothetical protein F5Y09DRAFT_102082 [Xylaria sp. FL1042]|nr:hypothetical protein F5Y09DRAFT_102082 [Xylaria sp. FL1042]